MLKINAGFTLTLSLLIFSASSTSFAGNGNPAGNNSSKSKSKNKVDICYSEASGDYVLLRLNTRSALSLLEDHPDNARLARDDGSCAENLLVNPDFTMLDGNGIPLGWIDGCGGTWGVSDAFEGLFRVEEACVNQPSLDDDVLAELEGKEFVYSCTYTSSSDGSASIATNLTTLRDETGQNETLDLPQTYFGTDGGFQLETVTMTGQAKDELVDQAGGFFVSFGSRDGAIDVQRCSLTAW